VGVSARANGGLSLADAVNGFAAGKKYYKDAKSQIAEAQSFATAELSKSSPAWWAQPLAGAASALATWAPQVSAVAGFLTSFIGGKRQPAPQPMQWRMDLTGSLKLEGTLKHPEPVLTLNLPIPGTGRGAPGTHDMPLGLVAILGRPVVRVRTQYKSCHSLIGVGYTSEVHSMDPLPVTVGEGIEVDKVEYAMVSEASGPAQFAPTPLPITTNSEVFFIGTPGHWCSIEPNEAAHFGAQRYTRVAVKITLKPFSESRNGPDDLVLIRVYPARVVSDFVEVPIPPDEL
jgi:hypothetical protein